MTLSGPAPALRDRLSARWTAAFTALWVVVLITCAAPVASAQSAVMPAVPAHIAAQIPQARLAGAGSFRYFGLSVYDAQLWVGPGGYQPAAPPAEKIALDLRYARTLIGKKIAASSIAEIRKLGLGTAPQQAHWLADMDALFPDVQEGTHMTGIYLPHQGVRFYRDGTFLGAIPDPAFGEAFFAIWLDPRTSGVTLRSALLVDAAQR